MGSRQLRPGGWRRGVCYQARLWVEHIGSGEFQVHVDPVDSTALVCMLRMLKVAARNSRNQVRVGRCKTGRKPSALYEQLLDFALIRDGVDAY